jgi:hypothetical protein
MHQQVISGKASMHPENTFPTASGRVEQGKNMKRNIADWVLD